MVGRTPEYLGKKIEAYDVKMAMLVALVFPLIILVLHRQFHRSTAFGTSSICNPGPHGLTQILYAFTSQAGNNGSAFGGLNGNTLWYNTARRMTMLVGRFLMIIPMLAIAGNLAKKKTCAAFGGHIPGDDAAVHRAAGGGDCDRRRADIFPGAQSGTGSRAPADDGREDFLRQLWQTKKARVLGREDRPASGARCLREARIRAT